jgi:formyl-CoA transferase
VRVVEVGVFIAAPFATMQLADLGADVIKVESPGGSDPVRAAGPIVNGESVPFALFNRNKRSVALNLKDPRGREAFLRLVQDADVLVENLRPGAMRRLGLGYEDVRAVNPQIIYASASGWGQDGPLAHLPGLDIMAQARGGLMSITGTEAGEPVKVGVPICDLACAMYVALGVCAALRVEPERRGQYLDVSLFEAGVSFAVWEAAKYFVTGEVGRPLGTAHQTMAPYQAVRTADGHVTVGAVTERTWTALCTALGLRELLDDERFADGSRRHAHRREVVAAIEAVTTTLPTAEVVRRLDEVEVPCAPIARYDEVFTSEQLTSRGFFWDAEHPVLGRVRQLGSPMRYSRTPTRRASAGPLLGADTRRALLEVGYDERTIDDLVREGIAGEPCPPTA